jgi:hypothetical protein
VNQYDVTSEPYDGWVQEPEDYTDPFAPAPPAPESQAYLEPPSSFAFRRAPEAPARSRPRDPWVDLRNQIIDRLGEMNARHRHHAWQSRNARPLCPHGLAVFYREPDHDRDPPRWVLRTATRMLLAGEESEDLTLLLYHLGGIADEYLAKHGRLDPRYGVTRMVQRAEAMSATAEYVGVGVSSLDTPVDPHTGLGGFWRDMQRSAAGVFDIPGRMYAHLVDDTRILLDRRGQREGDRFLIVSTEELNMVHGRFIRSWQRDVERPPRMLRDPATGGVWRELARLNDLFRQGHGDHRS